MGAILNPKTLMHASAVIGLAFVLIGAIIIERASNDLILDHLHPWVVMGIGLIVTGIGLTAVIVRKVPTVPFIVVLVIGIICIIIGIALTFQPSAEAGVIIGWGCGVT